MDTNNKSSQYPGPPPAYEEFAPPHPIPNSNPNQINLIPNLVTNLPNNPSSINSSVIPILPTAPTTHQFIPNYGSTQVHRIYVNETQSSFLQSENFVCPVCNIGLLTREFTLLGFLLAIFLFPFGLVCLFLLRKWRCSLCSTSFGY